MNEHVFSQDERSKIHTDPTPPTQESSSESSSSSTSSSNGSAAVAWGATLGVTIPAVLISLGYILLLRGNFVLGVTGFFASLGIVVLIHALAFLSVLTITAIITNEQSRGGGAYYLVSRVLGPEFGAPVGLGIFCTQVLYAALCLIGIADILSEFLPGLKTYRMYIPPIGLVIIFVCAFYGRKWLARLNVVLALGCVFGIGLGIAGGMQLFSLEKLGENWTNTYTQIFQELRELYIYSFWGTLALLIPLAGGVLVSINAAFGMKNITRNIPVGLFTFLIISLGCSLIWMIIMGGAIPREDLIRVSFPAGYQHGSINLWRLAVLGVLGACVGGAWNNLLGASTVLQAIGQDGLLPGIKFMGGVTKDAFVPRRAMWFAALVILIILAMTERLSPIMQFNALLGVASRFTLYTLGMLNGAAFFEAFLQTPSFRPRFRVFHWGIALVACVGCFAIPLFIRPIETLVIVLVLLFITWYTKKRELDEAFGDAERGFLYKAARNNLVKLSYKSGPQTWSPTSLVFSGNPETRETLVSFAVWLSAGRGVVFLANILVGKLEEYAPHRDLVAQRLKEFCAWKRIEAFPIVVVAQDLLQGVSSILQTVSLGPIRPNIAIFGWTGDATRIHTAAEQYRLAKAMDMSVILVHGDERPFFYDRKRIDIWWRNDKDGRLMLRLAHLLRHNWEWAQMSLRIIKLVDSPVAVHPTRLALEKILAEAKIYADIEVVVSVDEPFQNIFTRFSADADCIFLDFEVPSPETEEAWYTDYTALLKEMPPVILVSSQAPESLF